MRTVVLVGLLLVAACAQTSCAPANPSAASLTGRWKVDWKCGVETLDLRADGTYVYAIEFAAGGRATDSGSWRLMPGKSRLRGAEVVLLNAIETCSVFGEKTEKASRGDRSLEAMHEYGRTLLLFNPDIQGFARDRGDRAK